MVSFSPLSISNPTAKQPPSKIIFPNFGTNTLGFPLADHTSQPWPDSASAKPKMKLIVTAPVKPESGAHKLAMDEKMDPTGHREQRTRKLKKKKKSEKSKGGKLSHGELKNEVFWAMKSLTVKRWADVDEEEDDPYFEDEDEGLDDDWDTENVKGLVFDNVKGLVTKLISSLSKPISSFIASLTLPDRSPHQSQYHSKEEVVSSSEEEEEAAIVSEESEPESESESKKPTSSSSAAPSAAPTTQTLFGATSSSTAPSVAFSLSFLLVWLMVSMSFLFCLWSLFLWMSVLLRSLKGILLLVLVLCWRVRGLWLWMMA